MKVCVAGIVALLLTCAAARGQDETGKWVTHLYMNDIHDVAITEQGIWCATGGGALCYDFELRGFRAWNRASDGLASDTLTAVAALDDGRIAFGTSSAGVSVYDPERSTWSTYTTLTWPIAGNGILCIVEEPPWRIIGSRGGFVAFNDGEAREACQQGVDICGVPGWNITGGVEYQGALWLGALHDGAQGGVARFNHSTTGEWESLNTGLFVNAPEVIGFAVWEDSLFCAYRGGVAVWDGSEWARRRTGLPSGTEIRDICAGPQDLLLATSGIEGGVFEWDVAQQAWTRLGTMDAQCVAQEAGGIVWAGTGATRTDSAWLPREEDGLWAYVGGEWIQHRHDGPHPLQNYRDLAVDAQGRLWVAMAAGGRGWALSRLDEGGWDYFNRDNTELSDTWVMDLRPQGDAVWAGHCCCSADADPCYLNRWEPASGEVAVHDSVHNVYASIEDSAGDIWFASWFEGSAAAARGLYHLDVETGRVENYTTTSTAGRLRSDRITDLALGDDGLWIGYQEDGATLAHLDSQGLPILEDWAWETYTTDDADQPLPSDGVRALAARPGEIWIGTIAGVSLYRDGEWRIFRPGPFGLPGSEVTDVALTADGAAWIAMRDGGVTRILRDAAGAYSLESFSPPELVNPAATELAVGAEGRDVWIGTEHGLTHFIPLAPVDPAQPANVDVFPNPYNPRCGEPLRLVQIPGRAARGVIADVSGRLLARFADKWAGEAIWDGRDPHGGWAAPGCYVIRVSTPRGWLNAHVVVLDLPCSEY